MAADCGLELKSHGVTFISLWPGPVKTELVQIRMNARKAGKVKPPTSTETLKLGANAAVAQAMAQGQCESTEFAGKCIAKLLQGKIKKD